MASTVDDLPQCAKDCLANQGNVVLPPCDITSEQNCFCSLGVLTGFGRCLNFAVPNPDCKPGDIEIASSFISAQCSATTSTSPTPTSSGGGKTTSSSPRADPTSSSDSGGSLASSTGSDRPSSPSDGAASLDEPTGTAQPPSGRGGDPSGNTGLSTGAKAGIVVGVVLLVLACFLAALFLLRRRKKRRTEKAAAPDAAFAAGAVPELSGKERQPLPEMEAGENGNVHPMELDSRTRAELVGDSRHGPAQSYDPPQQGNGSPVYEMDGSRHGLPASGPVLLATSSSPTTEPPPNIRPTGETTTALAPL